MGPETTEEPQQINRLPAPHTASAHSPSRTLPSVKWGQTHLPGHFFRASLGSKSPCSHPSRPLTLLSKVSLSQACSFSTSLIRFLLWSCEKQGARDCSSGGWNHLQAPSPPNSKYKFKGGQYSQLTWAQIKKWPASLKFSLVGD